MERRGEWDYSLEDFHDCRLSEEGKAWVSKGRQDRDGQRSDAGVGERR